VKRVICLLLVLLMMPVAAFAAFDSAEAAQAKIDEYMASLPMDEEDESGQAQVYPEAFGGMYVDESNNIVVCLTEDTPENRQEYIDFFGSDDGLVWEVVELPYSTLMQYYITIGARHVSTQYVIINLYKTKRYEINPAENRVDVYMFAEPDTLEEILEYFSTLGFGDGVYIYFVDEEDTEVLKNQDQVYAEIEEKKANATPEPEPEPSATVAEELEESGFSFAKVVVPLIVVVVLVGGWFVIGKLRAGKKDLSEIDEFSDEFK